MARDDSLRSILRKDNGVGNNKPAPGAGSPSGSFNSFIQRTRKLISPKRNTPMQDPTLRVTLLPKDTNGNGTIFGGVILSHIDLAAALEAQKHTEHRVVTVAMDRVVFKQPVLVGDVVSFYTETLKTGNKSVTIRIKVQAMRLPSRETIDVTEAEAVFVAIDSEGKSTPLKSKTTVDCYA